MSWEHPGDLKSWRALLLHRQSPKVSTSTQVVKPTDLTKKNPPKKFLVDFGSTLITPKKHTKSIHIYNKKIRKNPIPPEPDHLPEDPN